MPTDLKNGELPEFPVNGPFGGVQSEESPDRIESIGFADTENIMFKDGKARVRPSFNDVTQDNPFLGVETVEPPLLVRMMDLVGAADDRTALLVFIQKVVVLELFTTPTQLELIKHGILTDSHTSTVI
jgi:hypothetical protein